MNKDQTEIIIQYLNIDTNYALIINGPYGIGKTHFYKNELTPKINEIPLPKNNLRKFIPIHISLFGFKSIEEIQTAIFVELYPILKNKHLKLVAGIAKSIIRGITQVHQGGDIDRYIGDVKPDAEDWLKYDELVICFDDLDRKSNALDLRDIFGFINSLVENQGAKILLIANNDELSKDENYSSELWEKVIGVSMLYNPETESVFNQIITSKYFELDKTYFEFLQKHDHFIIQTIESNKRNFRNLIFFLEHFRLIFNSLESKFQSEKEFSILKDEKQKAIIDFTLAISIEYKLGLLNANHFEEIKEIGVNPFDRFDKKQFQRLMAGKNEAEKEEKPSYASIFTDKYFKKTKLYFFDSIFNYLTGKTKFEIDLLKTELETYFIVKDGEIPEHEVILKELDYFDCLLISDKEYRNLTNKMLDFMDKGVYQLRQYATLFHNATRFNNLLNLNIEKLKKRMKKAILLGKSNYSYEYNLDFYLSGRYSDENNVDFTEVIKFILNLNNSLNESKNKDEILSLFELFKSDYLSFKKKVTAINNEYRFIPFWLDFDIKRTYNQIKRLENDKIWELGHYFKNRYIKNIPPSILPEKSFVMNLKNLIGTPSKTRNKKNLKNASLDYLLKCLKESEMNFPISASL